MFAIATHIAYVTMVPLADYLFDYMTKFQTTNYINWGWVYCSWQK